MLSLISRRKEFALQGTGKMSELGLKAWLFIENLADGTALDRTISRCPVGMIAMLYRRGGHMIGSFLCCSVAEFVLQTIPFPRAGFIGWFFRGSFIPFVIIEWINYDFFANSILPHVNTVTLPFLNMIATITIVLGLLVIFLDSKVNISPQKYKRMEERAKIYKEQYSIPLRFCSSCETFTVFRSQHSHYSDKCIAKYEFESFALNTSIGARNILAITLFYFSLMVYHFKILEAAVDILDKDKVMEGIESYQILLYGYITIHGMYNSFRSFIAGIVSIVTGVTWHERKNGFKAPYFTSPRGNTNPFNKGVLNHCLEAFFAFLGFDPAKNYSPLDVAELFQDDEETKKTTDAPENWFSQLINPYATRLPTNWVSMDVLTMFEVDCELRILLLKKIQKLLESKKNPRKSQDYDGEEDDDELFEYEAPKQNSSHQHGSQCGKGGCSHSHTQPKVQKSGGCCSNKGCSTKNHTHQPRPPVQSAHKGCCSGHSHHNHHHNATGTAYQNPHQQSMDNSNSLGNTSTSSELSTTHHTNHAEETDLV